MKFWAAMVQLSSSAIGGALGGWFVLLGVKAQFHEQRLSALRALGVEVRGNEKAAVEMIQDRKGLDVFESGKADPGWLKSAIWQSQLPYVAQALDDDALSAVTQAYGSLELVRGMFVYVQPENRPRYCRGGPYEAQLDLIANSFAHARSALEKRERQLRYDKTWSARTRRVTESVKRLFVRASGSINPQL